MLNHLGFFFFLLFFFFFFPKVRVGAKEGGSHYWEMAVAITCGYGGYLLPLLAAHSSFCWCNQKQRAVKPFDSQRFECGMIIGYFCMVINQQFPSWSGLKPINTVYFPFPTSGPIWKAWQTVHGLVYAVPNQLCAEPTGSNRDCATVSKLRGLRSHQHIGF